MRTHRTIRSLAAIMMLGCSSIALAQEQSRTGDQSGEREADVKGENHIIVEGVVIGFEVSETAKELAAFGTQVQVITDDEIKTGGFTNFAELAAGLIRGANVGYSPDEGEFTIRIDGGTDRDTLLLVDGVPYFDRSSPLEDIWPATAIDPRMVSSVEVFRGGQSLYFGSNGGLGVVSTRLKQPDGDFSGELGLYGGSFKTREIYGNVTIPLPIGELGEHSVMFFGRNYQTDSNTLFDREAFADTLLELGAFREYPYNYTSIGAKYLWQINLDTEFRAGFQFVTVDFEDTFPNSTPFAPNKTEFPIYNASFKSQINDRLRVEVEGHYQKPSLRNTEFVPLVCSIPRVQDLPANVRGFAPTGGFSTAAAFEAFAAANNLPAGCVTNPQFNQGAANVRAREGIFVNPANGQIFGTLNNPFPIGNPMGLTIQSVATFGTGVPVKGIGDVDQFVSGYTDYGINGRSVYRWNDWFETVVGVQNTSYKDSSSPVFGVQDVTLRSTGIYGDLRFSLPLLRGLDASISGRKDFNSGFADESIWKVGLRQELPGGFYLRGTGGTSYSAPKIDEIGAFGSAGNINPGIESQSVEAYNVGAGINGNFSAGSFNIELGYFDTEIENLFGDRSIESVCREFAAENMPGGRLSLADIERNRSTIVPPDAFCATAASANISPLENVAVNTLNLQKIKGYTVDVSLDTDFVQLDATFTKNRSLEPNPIVGTLARLDGTSTNLDFVIPGDAGAREERQSSERPKWSISGLVTFKPTDRWIVSFNPRYQGPEFAYAGVASARLVDANGNRTVPDLNFGNYFVLNASIQYYLDEDARHRFMVRLVNLLDEDYFERATVGADLRVSRAAVRGEIDGNDSAFYRTYGWNGKPASIWLQYEYKF